jgi:uncharacterized membrane protein YdjX (TVP38/TMEM64 family)
VIDPATTKSYLVKLGVLALAFAAYFYLPGIQEFITNGLAYLRLRNFEGLRQFILAYGVWAPLTSISLMAIQSMVPFVPGIAITITNAWIFGWELGAFYSWIGALLGATLDFEIARWYGRPVVERFISGKMLDKADGFFKKNGVLAVFITRLTPIVPFKVISYGAGLTKMPHFRFAIATGIGQAPAIVLYSFIGQNLTRSLRATIAVTSLLMVLGFTAYYFRDTLEKYFFSANDKEP